MAEIICYEDVIDAVVKALDDISQALEDVFNDAAAGLGGPSDGVDGAVKSVMATAVKDIHIRIGEKLQYAVNQMQENRPPFGLGDYVLAKNWDGDQYPKPGLIISGTSTPDVRWSRSYDVLLLDKLTVDCGRAHSCLRTPNFLTVDQSVGTSLQLSDVTKVRIQFPQVPLTEQDKLLTERFHSAIEYLAKACRASDQIRERTKTKDENQEKNAEESRKAMIKQAFHNFQETQEELLQAGIVYRHGSFFRIK